MTQTRTHERHLLVPERLTAAFLSGHVTQLRRVLSHPTRNEAQRPGVTQFLHQDGERLIFRDDVGLLPDSKSPFGPVGTTLWLKESYRAGDAGVEYRADVPPEHRGGAAFHAAIKMPRAASRWSGTVETLRVARLHAMTDADAQASGYVDRAAFQDAWDIRYENEPGSQWAANPWVVTAQISHQATRRAA
ncbi:hypothetical protein [Deinococcus soli (ex Cha et al. 2016)]|uniref:Uncharacterized protein n=2 Tax=Deinococcus soli (ex Cha et al. 2016) TaxID=1309411 RepID=A0ACC6KFJ7_9DEIO|nr:hypothetical protein [Deinococcus soli (ex Cha et al. 2016)]MDR6218344.1 hypothetical protein [Deinococcus soli (ex Cha et al. 2016)]MDR6329084.1 hypothetical protein [Deinococcus soli (ex Cha et al. 2016)]MDR6751357.1 hypothetical protein [Deinococcus soli (ex Cha et al. 2016)]